MNSVLLNTNTFHIISYTPFSEINNEMPTNIQAIVESGFPKEGIIDINNIGKTILGSVPSYNIFNDTNGEFNISTFSSNGQINTIVMEILRARFAQKLPTILVGNFPAYSKVEKYMQLSAEYGYSSQLHFYEKNESDILSNYKISSHIYPETHLKTFIEASKIHLNNPSNSKISEFDKIISQPNFVTHKDLEVIGDVHGMLPQVVEHLAKKGWIFDGSSFSHPSKEKAILFLGDVVDRHPQSVEMLKVIKNTCLNGQGYLLLGNHESKLLKSYGDFLDNGIVRGRSLSSSQTFTSFLKLPHKDRQELYLFLLSRPTSYIMLLNEKMELTQNFDDAFIKLGFNHADTTHFNPFNNSVTNSLYGVTKDFSPLQSKNDEIYDKGYHNNLHDYILFRGHCTNQGKFGSIYSLDYDQAFNGHIASINTVDYLSSLQQNNFVLSHELFTKNTLLTETNYNFDDEFKKSLYSEVLRLLDKKLIVDGVFNSHHNPEKKNHHEGFQIFKYSKSVHFDRLWKTEEAFTKTRGIVFDIGGQIIVHPFDKLYNYEEYDSGKHLTKDSQVRAVEKMNGFLGCITKHPYRNDLIFSTTGSLEGTYVDYIKSFISPEQKVRLLNFFAANGNQTLLFEVIHPEDPHFIKYTEEQQGLWLIGARGLNESDKIKTENELDIIGSTLSFKRPSHFTCKFSELLTTLETCNHEGFMVWEIDGNGQETPVMKIKSNYYLISKFLSKMSDKRIDSLYKNPKVFQQTIDEEFYALTEHIVATIPIDSFKSMNKEEKVDIIQNFIQQQRLQTKTSPSIINK